MKEIALARARWFVLQFLLDNLCISEHGHQVTEETVVKHVSREFSDRDRKIVWRALSQLISHGLVGAKKKHYGTHTCG
jgi:hypothetical protein